MTIITYPIYIIYLISFFFFPKTDSVILMIVILLFGIYIFFINKNLKFKDDDFSDEEKKILYKYPLFFRYYFFSTSMSNFLSFIQMTTILLSIFILWKSLFIYLIPLIITFFICSKLRMKLNPLFILKEQHKTESKFSNKDSLNLLKQQSFNKFKENFNEFIFDKRSEDRTVREIYLIEKIYNQFWNKKEKDK